MSLTENNSVSSKGSIEKLMRRATLFSLGVGCLLVAIKTGAWLYTNSLSLLSSLADSLLDVIASTLNFIAVRYALQPPDREHRFGHGKAEDLATLAQSTFICGSGVFLIIAGVRRILSPEPVHNSTAGLLVMGISMAATIALVIYQQYVVKKTASTVIAADALHYFIDFITNASVILALVLSSALGWTLADPIIAILIAASIIIGAFMIGYKAFQNLMDHEFSEEERTSIKKVVLAHSDVMGLHDLRTRRSGIYRFIQFHLDLGSHITLKRAHEISDAVEKSLTEAFPNTEILIHQDPRDAQEIPSPLVALNS